MGGAYLNHIVTTVPDHDIHHKFVDYALTLIANDRDRALFKRMASRSGIEHRYSFFNSNSNLPQIDDSGFYNSGAFPDTGKRMQFYTQHAFNLARKALDGLGLANFKDSVTHIIVTTCTGLYAPGIDLQIIEHYGLNPAIERTVVGFMGCYAAMNALKLARHIVRSDDSAKVVILNLELCTLHLQETGDLEKILSFLIFADGCAASLVSAEQRGLELISFHAGALPDSRDQITWHVGNQGFDMVLSGQVPGSILTHLPALLPHILGAQPMDNIRYWAIHPGGRTILDAVQKAIALPEEFMRFSRTVLRNFGNMSSATIMFVLRDMMAVDAASGKGCAMAFGPGVTIESMLFQFAGI